MVDTQTVQAEGAFICTEQLASMIASYPKDQLCILNSSFKSDAEGDVFREHLTSRIPGAKFLDLTIVRDMQSPYPFMMPNKQHFVRMMKALNVKKSQTVVVYETGKGWFATRAAFMLKTFGHPNVYILDGHFAKWTSEGRPTEGEDQSTFDSDFDYNLIADNILSYERIKEVSGDGSIQIVETRPLPAVESTGKIPNAICLPAPSMLGPDGAIKSAAELNEMFQSKGVDVSKPIVFSCGGGVMATLGYACALKAGITG